MPQATQDDNIDRLFKGEGNEMDLISSFGQDVKGKTPQEVEAMISEAEDRISDKQDEVMAENYKEFVIWLGKGPNTINEPFKVATVQSPNFELACLKFILNFTLSEVTKMETAISLGEQGTKYEQREIIKDMMEDIKTYDFKNCRLASTHANFFQSKREAWGSYSPSERPNKEDLESWIQ